MISRWHEGGVQDAGNSLVLAIEIVYIIDNLMLFHQAIRTYDFYTFYKYDIIKQKYVVKKIYSWIKDKTGACVCVCLCVQKIVKQMWSNVYT